MKIMLGDLLFAADRTNEGNSAPAAMPNIEIFKNSRLLIGVIEIPFSKYFFQLCKWEINRYLRHHYQPKLLLVVQKGDFLF